MSKRKKCVSPSFVFLLTGLDISQRQSVTHVCTHSSVRSVLEYSEEGISVGHRSAVVTHCIANTSVDEDGDYTTDRTVKYLLSILAHKPVVSFDWIAEIEKVVNLRMERDKEATHSDIVTTSVSVEQFPSWEPFAVKGDHQMAHCTKGGPSRSLSSRKVGHSLNISHLNRAYLKGFSLSWSVISDRLVSRKTRSRICCWQEEGRFCRLWRVELSNRSLCSATRTKWFGWWIRGRADFPAERTELCTISGFWIRSAASSFSPSVFTFCDKQFVPLNYTKRYLSFLLTACAMRLTPPDFAAFSTAFAAHRQTLASSPLVTTLAPTQRTLRIALYTSLFAHSPTSWPFQRATTRSGCSTETTKPSPSCEPQSA